ncbi:hypothetical protein GCM10012275_49130 [Longimycelium tulufanense]|uniref:Uncharacterized protein n=1 Tax=Longimycelium tulufanense TaxID=907463 RepID=A0A8J3FX97_9PSEU|nr:hypothetical protein [Longimycelium tulufanense]GGM72664.1 hypothetical protein GCM10012275_49130 [Longimycelium tulufanense]
MGRRSRQREDNDGSVAAEAGVTPRVRRLRGRLAESRQLKSLLDDPYLRVVQIERLRVSVTRGLWFFLVLGLGYTTPGVQEFLAGDRTPADPVWWGAWLAEPAFAGILIHLLRWEAAMLSAGVEIDSRAVQRLKRLLLAATSFMNVYPTLRPQDHEIRIGSVVAHLVVPVVVYLLAEVMPVVQQRCFEAKLAVSPVAPYSGSGNPAADVTASPSPAPASDTAVGTRLRLPGHLLQAVQAKAREVADQGRPLTAADVQATIKVGGDLAARIAAELSTTNGHRLPT